MSVMSPISIARSSADVYTAPIVKSYTETEGFMALYEVHSLWYPKLSELPLDNLVFTSVMPKRDFLVRVTGLRDPDYTGTKGVANLTALFLG